MKYAYRLSHPIYEMIQSENRYREMSKKGLFIDKVGNTFERYEKGEPKEMIYRIELPEYRFFQGNDEISDERINLYTSCGWRAVATNRYSRIFSAPVGSVVPDTYTKTKSLETMHTSMKKRFIASTITSTLAIIALLFIVTLYLNNTLDNLVSFFYFGIIEEPLVAISLAIALILLPYSFISELYAIVKIGNSIRTDSQIDRTSKKINRLNFPILNLIYTILGFLIIISSFFDIINNGTENTLEYISDGPYILLTDDWHGGERVDGIFDSKSNVIKRETLIVEEWDTREFVELNGEKATLYQNIYKLKFGLPAMPLLDEFVRKFTFSDNLDNYTKIEIDGLDVAYFSEFEIIAVKDDTIWYLDYLNFNDIKEELFPTKMLNQMVEQNKKAFN